MQGMLCHVNPNDDELDGYIENGRYHEQVAKWLEDYKHIKQWKSDIMEDFCRYDVNSFEELVTNVRNKTIDDFAEKAIKIVYEANNRDRNTQPRDMVADIHYKFIELAKKLKVGEQNE